MKFVRKLFLVITLFFTISLIPSCSFVEKINPGDFDEYSDKLLHTVLGHDELTLHFLFNDYSSLGIEETKLSLPTPGATSTLGKLLINLYFGPMKNYDYDTLTFDQKMTYNVIVDLLERINSKKYEMNYLDNNYLGSYLGYQAQLPVLLAQYRLNSLKDVENYFGLLRLVPETFKEYYDYEVKKSDAGFGMSDYVIEKVVAQCDSFITNREEHFLVKTFRDRLSNLDLTDEEKDELCLENKELIMNDVCDGYQYVRDNLPNLLGKATNDLGLCYYSITDDDGNVYELGKEYYSYLFRKATGYDENIEDVIVYMQGHLDNIISNIKTLQNNHPGIKEEAQNISLMEISPREQIEAYKTLIEHDFPSIEVYPEISVLDIDESMEDFFSPACYISSPIDDYSKEVIYLNQKKIDGDMNYLYNTIAHEGVPGHLYQNIYFKTSDANILRKILKNSGYQEGWATYVQLYVYNYCEGVDEDIIEYLKNYDILNGVLTARLDLGIHYEGWDAEDILEYMSKYFSNYDLDRCQRILEQLVEVPTNSQTYYYTYFRILDMRQRVMDALCDDYDPIEFHKILLDCGPLPLRFIEVVVDEYIANYEG